MSLNKLGNTTPLAAQEELQLLRQKAHYMRVITNFSTALLPLNTVEEIVWTIAKNAIAQLGYVDCVVYLKNPSNEYIVQRAAHGPKNPIDLDILNPIRIKIGEGIVGIVAQTGKPELINDTTKDSRYILDDAMRFSEIAVPIIAQDQKVIGVIDSEHPEKNFFSEADLETLTTIASIAATKIAQAKATEILRRSNRDLEQFAYIASHDLKEPLRMIGSYSQLLERRYNKVLDKDGQEFLQYIREGAIRMNGLIHDLLSYSRIDGLEKSIEIIDCQKIINTVLNNLNDTITQSNACIKVSKLPPVKAHFSPMVQLFQNLIANAIKFQADKIPLIFIDFQEEYAQYIFQISDNGLGIEAIYFEKIFRVFQRLNNRKDYAGSGIGLATCKKIVEHYGGRIWLESEVGVGTTFFFSIPK